MSFRGKTYIGSSTSVWLESGNYDTTTRVEVRAPQCGCELSWGRRQDLLRREKNSNVRYTGALGVVGIQTYVERGEQPGI